MSEEYRPVSVEVEVEKLKDVFLHLLRARNPVVIYTGDIDSMSEQAKQRADTSVIRACSIIRELIIHDAKGIENQFFIDLKHGRSQG